MLRPLSGLPVRITDDLRIEADPGAQLQPQQAFRVAETLIHTAARINFATRARRRGATVLPVVARAKPLA